MSGRPGSAAAMLAVVALLAGGGTAEAQPTGGSSHDITAAALEGINSRYLLQAHYGKAVTDQDFPGQFQLIAFGYTFCPDVCPTTLVEVAKVMDLLGERSARVQPLFITVDPERDTLRVLRTYVEFFHPRILGLRGSPELTRRVADHYRVRYEKVQEPGAAPEHYAVDHTAGLYLLGPDGAFVTKFAYGTAPKDIADRLSALIEANPLPPARDRH
ncbi:MAG: SCO family protein [Rhodocyclaceae bacterium]|nr:SCO family protein [Rhodocyclaceae bacterium]